MKVKTIMHSDVVCAKPNMSIKDAAKLMQSLDIGAIPVKKQNKIIGIITDRDITCRAVASRRDIYKLKVKDIMSEKIQYCGPEEDIDIAISKMENNKIRRLVVLDEDKKLSGIICLGDLANKVDCVTTGELMKSVAQCHELPKHAS